MQGGQQGVAREEQWGVGCVVRARAEQREVSGRYTVERTLRGFWHTREKEVYIYHKNTKNIKVGNSNGQKANTVSLSYS